MTTTRINLSNMLVEKGALAYHYVAGTTTPIVVFQDPYGSVPHQFPILADARGRMPAVYVPYGDFRERVITKGGVVLWDNSIVPNPAPVTAGGGATPPEFLFQTGDIKFRPLQGTLPGFVRMNGRTIGDVTSGATERANADTEALFAFLWNSVDNTVAPVSGGRGRSAAADWAAGKTIGIPDARRRSFIGLYGMGNALLVPQPGSKVQPTTSNVPGAAVGDETHTLSVGEIPSHGHGANSTVTDPGHAHPSLASGFLQSQSGGSANFGAGGGSISSVGATGSAATGISVATNITATGGGAAHSNVPPSLLVTFYQKL